MITRCADEYNIFYDEKKKHEKDQKTINDFLCELPEGSHQVLEHQELERLAQNEDNKFKIKKSMLEEFINAVK